MNRSTPVRRSSVRLKRTPLQRRTPLLRRTPFPAHKDRAVSGGLSPAGEVSPPVVPRSRARRFPVDVAALVAERSGGWCEAQLEGCSGRATEKHHRLARKMGGRHRSARRRSDRASNIVHLDAFCHHVVTLDPDFGYETGLSLREKQEPTQEWVLYRGEAVYLDDAGGVHDYETAGA